MLMFALLAIMVLHTKGRFQPILIPEKSSRDEPSIDDMLIIINHSLGMYSELYRSWHWAILQVQVISISHQSSVIYHHSSSIISDLSPIIINHQWFISTHHQSKSIINHQSHHHSSSSISVTNNQSFNYNINHHQ